MTQNRTTPIRHDLSAEVSLLRREHPAYEIQLLGARVWEAVSHPEPGKTVVHCAGSLDELRTKIEGDAP